MSIERWVRPLTDGETAELRGRIASLYSAQSTQMIKSGAASALVCALLCAATLAASDAPRVVVLFFWGAMAVGLTAWTGLAGRRDVQRRSSVLLECLRANRARVLRVRSERVVEIEEIEDEGACYAFQVSGDEILIVEGQEFYADQTFPNSDFSLVEILTSAGTVGDSVLAKQGVRLRPERQIGAAVKDVLAIPEHLSVIRGDLARIEQLLTAPVMRR
jgi:hypothetical protein